MQDERVVIEAFGDMAPRYEQVVDGELQRFIGWNYHSFIDNLIAYTPINPGDTVLDIATGTAVIPQKLHTRAPGQAALHGLDITLGMLKQANIQMNGQNPGLSVKLVCATAMAMPYPTSSFNLTLCALATHHMDVVNLLTEAHRVLKPGGLLAIADVGGKTFWQNPLVKGLLYAAGFTYFLFMEGLTRARAEAGAVSHVIPTQEWHATLTSLGFEEIYIKTLPYKYRWFPKPILILARKAI